MTDQLPIATDSPIASLIADAERLKDFPVEAMREAFAIYKEERADARRQAYAAAMNALQAEMVPVVKRHRNLQTNSMFAKLADVDAMLTPLMVKHGFSVSMSETDGAADGLIRFRMLVMHVDGHSEPHTMDLPVDGLGAKGNKNAMNALQGRGSSHSYALRYLKDSVFGVQLVDDDDGQSGGVGPGMEPLDGEQLAEIQALVDSVYQGNQQPLLDWLEVESMQKIPRREYRRVVRVLTEMKEETK